MEIDSDDGVTILKENCEFEDYINFPDVGRTRLTYEDGTIYFTDRPSEPHEVTVDAVGTAIKTKLSEGGRNSPFILLSLGSTSKIFFNVYLL